MKRIVQTLVLSLGLGFGAVQSVQAQESTAIFAGGCFWCMESDFESVPGVIDVQSGFIGGSAKTAKYKTVSKGGSGHYEAVKIRFNPKKVSYQSLLHKFWRSVDPTDAGGQFCDRGDSYRTAIFAVSKKQASAARDSKKAAEAALGKRVVTPVVPAGQFFPAEEFHQDYYKSSKKVVTRFGLIKRKDAYKRYRKACGRDAKIRSLWGAQAHQLGS